MGWWESLEGSVEKKMYNLELIKRNIKDCWGLFLSNPQFVCAKVSEVLREIRSIKARDYKLEYDISLLELTALHLLSLASLHSDNIPQGKYWTGELRDIAGAYDNSEYKALAEHVEALIEINSGLWLSAKQRLLKVLSILETVKNYEYVQFVLIDLSNIELDQNNYENSINLLLQAESEYQLHPINPRISSMIISNMATVYLRIGNLEKAIEYINRSLQESKQANDVIPYTNTLLRLSNVYKKQEEFTKQIETLQESISILLDHRMHARAAVHRVALGEAYMCVQNFEYSLKEFQEAIAIMEQKNDKKNIAMLHYKMGGLYSHPLFEFKDADTALTHFDKAEHIAIEISMPHFQAAVVEGKARALASFGLFEKGFEELDRYNSLEKKILNDKSLQQIHDLEVRYDVALKEKEILLLDADKKVLELERTHLQEQLALNNQYLFMYKKELNDFKAELLSITRQLDRAEVIVHKVKTKLRETLGVQDSWESYLEIFSKVHPEYKEKLVAKYPSLTEMEIRVCVLIRAGLISTEIAEILSLSYRTIENKRLIIRHKLEVKDKVKLDVFLSEI